MTDCTEYDTVCRADVFAVVWHPKAKEEISHFPVEVKSKFGYLIYRLQLGENLFMPQSRAMTSVAKELRVKGKDGIYRSFYLKLDGGMVTVFHAFRRRVKKQHKKI